MSHYTNSNMKTSNESSHIPASSNAWGQHGRGWSTDVAPSTGWGKCAARASGSEGRKSNDLNRGWGKSSTMPRPVKYRIFKGKVDKCYVVHKGWGQTKNVYHGMWVTVPHRTRLWYNSRVTRGPIEWYRGQVVSIKKADNKVLVRYDLRTWWERERIYTYEKGYEKWFDISEVSCVHSNRKVISWPKIHD